MVGSADIVGRSSRGVGLAAIAVALCACGGDPAGTPCKLESGALGFGFRDDCASKCLELSPVVCPDASTVRQAVCAGAPDCTPGSCPQGQACYTFDDPVEEVSFCVPDDHCGSMSAAERSTWESEAFRRAEQRRAEFAERMRRRTNKPTAPAAADP